MNSYLHSLGRSSLLDPTRRLALERDFISTNVRFASALAAASPLGAPPEDVEPPSPSGSDVGSSISPISSHHTRLYESTNSDPRSQHVRQYSPVTSSSDLNTGTPHPLAETISHLSDSSLDRPHLAVIDPEIQERHAPAPTNAVDPMTQVSTSIDRITLNSQTTFDEIHTEMKRNRGEVAHARSEMSTAWQMAKDSSSQNSQLVYLNQLPLVSGTTYDESLGCLETTRTEILANIIHFLTARDSERNVFLLVGPAGSGKKPPSRILSLMPAMSSIVPSPPHSPSSLGVNMRDKPDQLISSIAREFAGKNPAYAFLAGKAIEKDKGRSAKLNSVASTRLRGS